MMKFLLKEMYIRRFVIMLIVNRCGEGNIEVNKLCLTGR